MDKLVKKALLLGVGITTLTKENAERIVKDLKKDGVTKKEGKKLVKDLLKESKKAHDKIFDLVDKKVTSILNGAPFATKKDLDKLEKRLKKGKKKSVKKKAAKKKTVKKKPLKKAK